VINRSNPTPQMGMMDSTNPCGEQPLLPYEACVLGSINLSKYVSHKGGKPVPDYEALSGDIRTAVRFLDNTIDVNIYPLPEIAAMHRGNRKIGLGVMGWSDMLVQIGIPYDTGEAFTLARELMKFFRDRARQCSVELAQQRGVFPNFKGSVYDSPGMAAVRNATTTTIAPTGTLSIIADCSSGIEPLFALAYKRLIMDTELSEVNRIFFSMADELGLASEGLKQKIIRQGTLRGITGIPRNIKRLFRTAHEISYEHHIEMQASFQQYTDNAVSKTINMPKKATKKDVASAYLLAYEKGCKGVTVFRYGTNKVGTMVFPDTD